MARVRAGTKTVANVDPWQKDSGEKGQRRVARERPEHVGRVARQDTSQHGAGKEERTICTPSMETTVKTSNSQLTTKKICKHGVCWKKVKVISGKR